MARKEGNKPIKEKKVNKTGRFKNKRAKAKELFDNTTSKIKGAFQSKKNENKFNALRDVNDIDVITIDDLSDLSESDEHRQSFNESRRIRNTSSKDFITLDDSSDDNNEDLMSIKTAPAPSMTNLNNEDHNELTENNDFISLKFSDSEDDEQIDNEEDAYSMDDDETDLYPSRPKVNSETPWIKDHDHSTQKEIADWLTMEIKDFIAYISPSKEEIELRNSTVRRLKTKIESFWKDCEVNVFGSYATDLYLPGSDIDMVIISPNGNYDNRNSLYQLSTFLKRENLATNVEVVAKTKVPIIKFTEKKSGIHIDVSFERSNGVIAARVIRTWLQETPGLRELVLIVKQFLNSRKLNNVRVGGLGGFSIICLCYSFLTLHPRLSTGNISAMENIGVLLIEFFELYGRNFNYDEVAICVDEDNVCYLNKRYYPDLQGRTTFSLAIQDPKDPTNNISRGSFNLRDIRKAFNGAFEVLVNACYDMESATYRERIGKSVLGNVIKYKGSQREFSDDRGLAVNEVIESDQKSIVSKRRTVQYSEYETEESDHDVSQESNHDVFQESSNKIKAAAQNGKAVDDYMGLGQSDNEEDDDDEGIPSAKKLKRSTSSTSNLSKDERRDYWLQKGNQLA